MLQVLYSTLPSLNIRLLIGHLSASQEIIGQPKSWTWNSCTTDNLNNGRREGLKEKYCEVYEMENESNAKNFDMG